jgi:hypothetical protein
VSPRLAESEPAPAATTWIFAIAGAAADGDGARGVVAPGAGEIGRLGASDQRRGGKNAAESEHGSK